MARRWPEAKDPDEVLDFGVDWSAALAGDVIASSSWTVPSGITAEAQANTDTATAIRLAGGTAGQDYGLSNKVQTLIGRIFRQTWWLRVRSK